MIIQHTFVCLVITEKIIKFRLKENRYGRMTMCRGYSGDQARMPQIRFSLRIWSWNNPVGLESNQDCFAKFKSP